MPKLLKNLLISLTILVSSSVMGFETPVFKNVPQQCQIDNMSRDDLEFMKPLGQRMMSLDNSLNELREPFWFESLYRKEGRLTTIFVIEKKLTGWMVKEYGYQGKDFVGQSKCTTIHMTNFNVELGNKIKDLQKHLRWMLENI